MRKSVPARIPERRQHGAVPYEGSIAPRPRFMALVPCRFGKEGQVKIVQFLALVFAALALAPAVAHLASLPNKIDLAQADYFISQNIYRGWDLFGVALIGALLSELALVVMVRAQAVPALLAGLALLCQIATLAIFFAFTFPANRATDNWTSIPANWESLRWQWEISHAVNAVIAFVGFCALTASLLATRERS